MQSVSRRSSQQGGRGSATKRINLSLSQDVKLREVENAWKPATIMDLRKRVRAILNKLTPQKFAKLVDEIEKLGIDTIERLTALIDLIFEKPVDEPAFGVAYAQLCSNLQNKKVSTGSNTHSFKTLLLQQCQTEFEKDVDKEINRDKWETDIANAETEEKKKELQVGLEAAEALAKRRTLGNIRFIGELFKLQLLTPSIMFSCLSKLITAGKDDEDSLECLCRLLTTVGKTLSTTTKADVPKLDGIFVRMQGIVEGKAISSRIRFMLQDVIDLRKHNWVPRRSSESLFDSDGWSTVQGKRVVTDPVKLREMSQYGNNENIQLGPGGPGFKTWGSGSSGDFELMTLTNENIQLGPGGPGFKTWGSGGRVTSDSKDMKPPHSNRFSTLSHGEHEDRRTSTPRSGPPSRDSSLNRQSSGHRTSAHQYSSSRERKEAINNVKDLSSGSSRAGSQNMKRVSNNSAIKSNDNVSAKQSQVQEDEPSSKKMSEKELIKKTEGILDEFLHNCDLEAIIKEVEELKSFCDSIQVFVELSFNHVLERSEQARKQIGQLLYNLIKRNILTIDQYYSGMKNLLECADDLVVHIPMLWTYLGELIAPMIHTDNVPLTFLVQIAQPLLKNNCAGILVSEVLQASAKNVGEITVRNLWKSSGLRWSEFLPDNQSVDDFIKKNKLEFTVVDSQQPTSYQIEEVKNKLNEFLNKRNASNEGIMDWIDNYVGPKNVKDHQFIRALMTAVCESAIKGEGSTAELNEEALKGRTSLLQKYLDNQESLELQALYALQSLLYRMEHSVAVVRNIFDRLYDEEAISEDAFLQYENKEEPGELEGRAVLMKSLTLFFTWLRDDSKDCAE